LKDRQKDRELDRWTYEKRIWKQTTRCKHKLMERQTDRKMNRQKRDRKAGTRADRQGKSQTKKRCMDGQTNRWKRDQRDRRINRQTCGMMDIHTYRLVKNYHAK